jgi:hypothetical protein
MVAKLYAQGIIVAISILNFNCDQYTKFKVTLSRSLSLSLACPRIAPMKVYLSLARERKKAFAGERSESFRR